MAHRLVRMGQEGSGREDSFGVCEAAQCWASSLVKYQLCWLVALHVNDGEEQVRQLSGSQTTIHRGGPVQVKDPRT